MRLLAAIPAIALLLCAVPAAAQSDLERARTLYNSGQFEAAVAAATSAMSNRPALAKSARLIIARARLERFRQSGAATELNAARTDLIALNPAELSPQEAIEWQVGVATSLFLENQLGPAAEMFMTLLPNAREHLSVEQFQKLLDWAGTAIFRFAESLTGDGRKQMYERLLAGVRTELERNPFSGPAAYWTVVSARGAGDFDGAWNAAIAGWIRVSAQPDAQEIHDELNTFVTRTLIPERAQARSGRRLDAEAAVIEIAALTEEWRDVTSRWNRAAED